MKLHFSHILRKYEKEVTVFQNNSQLSEGRIQQDNNKTTGKIVIMPLTSEQIDDYEGGNYTRQDRKIILRENSDIELSKNDIIEDDEGRYEIRERTPWLDFADFETFVAKKVVVE